jgi:hypothetical protein
MQRACIFVGMAARDRVEIKRWRRIWPWPPLTLRDVIGALFSIILLVVFFLWMILRPEVNRRINYGFGPEWDCDTPGKLSALNCIKRLPGN